MTPERIRAAAQVLRVTYLPIMLDGSDDWRDSVDISEPLADLLDAHASLVEYAPPRASKGFQTTISALVDAIEGAHP